VAKCLFVSRSAGCAFRLSRPTAIADPTIPPVAGEPGATFVFSQILGINDHGIVVGYYGDSTTSQHGFHYNAKTVITPSWTIPARRSKMVWK
jgi:hypothetical protein